MVPNIRITPWPKGTGVIHTATSWQLSTADTFNNIVVNNLEDTEHLTSYTPDITIPIGTTIYVRVKRHFNNGASTDWTILKPITNSEQTFGLDTVAELKVEPPVLTVSDDIKDVNSPTFTVSTSKYATNIPDNHESTHWVITDGFKKVLFTKLGESENKLSLTVNKDQIDMQNMNAITVMAIHRSVTGVESAVGSLPVSIVDVNFDVETNLKGVEPYKNLTVSIAPIDESKPLDNYIKVVIVDNDDKEIVTSVSDSGRVTVIPGSYLLPNKTYKMIVYGSKTNDDIQRTYYLEIAGTNFCKLYPDYKYMDRFTPKDPVTLQDTLFNTTEMYNGHILIPHTDAFIYKHAYTDGALREVVKVTDINISDIKQGSYTTVIPMPNKKVVIDYTNTNDKRVFAIYDYIEETDSFNNEHKIVRDNEPFTANLSQTFTIVSETELVYITDLKLMKLDTSNLDLRQIDLFPSNIKNLSIVHNCKGKLFVLWGSKSSDLSTRSNDNIYMYDMYTRRWSIYDTVPDTVPDDILIGMAALRKDGHIQIFNHTTGNTSSNSISYDPDTRVWSVKDNTAPFDKDYHSTVVLNNGKFLKLSTDGKVMLFD